MHRVFDDQTNVPVNPRARVPARSRLPGSICTNSEDVVFTKIEMRCQLVTETYIAVRAIPQMKAVYPNVRIRHHAVEFNEHQPVAQIARHREVFAVPPSA